jgi:hypothetical protein
MGMTQSAVTNIAIAVRYPMHVKPGDLVAGVVNMHAPTRPCQPFATAMRVESVEIVTPDPARPRVKHYRFNYVEGFTGNAYETTDQIMVITGA